MALSGSFKNVFRTGYGVEIDWSATQSIANNTSTITAKFYLCSYGSSYTINSSATKYGYVSIDGVSQSFSTAGAGLSGNQRKLLTTKSRTITHNDDGTKTFSLLGSYDLNVTLSGKWWGTVQVSGSATLNTIPRKSKLTSSPSWTAGNNLPISISRASSSFTHDVKIEVWDSGTQSYQHIKTLTGLGSTYTWNPSLAENTAIFENLAQDTTYYNQGSKITLTTKNGTSTIGTETYTGTVSSPSRSTTSWGGDFDIGESLNGTITRSHSEFKHKIQLIFGASTYTLHDNYTGTSWTYDTNAIANNLYEQTPDSNTLSGYIRMYTYFNGIQVKDYAQSTINAYVTNSNPTMGDTLTYSDTNINTVNITNNNTKIIQNQSTVRVVLPVGSKAEAQNGSTMEQYVAILGGVEKTAPYSETTDVVFDFGTINASVDQTLSIRAIDSRGNSVTKTRSVTMIPYNYPSINATAKRTSGFEEETTLTMNGTIAPINVDGVNKNSVISVQYRYKPTNVETAPTWDTWTDFTFSTLDNTYTADNVTLQLENTSSFHVEFIVTDKLENMVFAITVRTGQPLFFIDHLKGSVSVGKFPDNPKSFEIDGDIRLKNGNIYKDGVLFEGGTDTSNGIVFDETVARAIEIVTKDNDVDVVRVGNADGYGYYLKYVGTGTVNDNTLELWSENITDPNDIQVIKIWQDGQVEIPKLRTINETNLGNTVLIGNEIRFTNSGGVSYFQAGLDANDSTHELRIGRAYTTFSNLKLLRLMADEVIIQGSITQDNRIGASLQNGWVNYGGGYATASYYKDKNGVVHITGLIRGGTTTAGTNLFNLPSGYRPEGREIHVTFGAGLYHCRIDVLPDGNVQAHTNVNSSWTSLAGISFRAEN